MEIRLYLQVRDEPGIVKHGLAAIRHLFKLVEWDEKDIFRALLISDEAIQNAVDAGRRLGDLHGERRDITIRVGLNQTMLNLTVSNHGGDYLSEKRILTRRIILKGSEPELMGERGRGLTIMAQYADRLTIRRNTDGRITVKAAIICNGRREDEG